MHMPVQMRLDWFSVLLFATRSQRGSPMNWRSAFVVAVGLAAAAACAVPGAPPPRTPPGERTAPTQIADTPRTVVVIGDTEATLYGGPGNATVQKLGYIHNHLFAMAQTQSTPPADIQQVLTARGVPRSALVDSWGTEIRYYVSADHIELRSAGPDGEFRSLDDVVVAGIFGRRNPCLIRTTDGRILDFSEGSEECKIALLP